MQKHKSKTASMPSSAPRILRPILVTSCLAGLIVGIWNLRQEVPRVAESLKPQFVASQSQSKPLSKHPDATTTEDGLVASQDAIDPDKNPYMAIYHKHPELKQSEYLNSVVLETPEVQAKRSEIFTRYDGVKKAFDQLTDDQRESFGHWTPLERVFWINWIKQAARLEDNPQRPYIKERLFAGIVQFPVDFHALSTENRKSIMADKIELYFLALRYFQDDVEELNSEMKDERLQKMVSYARKNAEYLLQMDLRG